MRNKGLAPCLFLLRKRTHLTKLTHPEEFTYRLCDALEGSRSKSVYATDAKLLPNSRFNQLRTPITDDFLEVTDKAAIQCLRNGLLIAGKVCKCYSPINGFSVCTKVLC